MDFLLCIIGIMLSISVHLVPSVTFLLFEIILHYGCDPFIVIMYMVFIIGGGIFVEVVALIRVS